MLKNDPIFVGSDNAIWLKGLRADDALDTYINDATVTFSLHTTQAAAVAGTGAIADTSGTASYITGSNGEYRGILDDAATVGLTVGTKYFLRIHVDAGSGRKDLRVLEYTARARGGM
jgi:hypothetical protein